jgi:hypothetical protein
MSIHDDDDEFKAKAKEESIEEALEKASSAFSDDSEKDNVSKVKNLIDSLSNEEFIEIVKHIFTKITVEAISEKADINMKEDEAEGEGLMIKIPTEIKINETEETIEDINNEDLSMFIPTNILVHLVNSTDFVQLSSEDDQYTGFTDYAAKEINKKDISLNMPNAQVYALIANNGNYLTDKFGRIICVAKVDNKYVNHVTLISKNKAAIEGNIKTTSELKPGATAQ